MCFDTRWQLQWSVRPVANGSHSDLVAPAGWGDVHHLADPVPDVNVRALIFFHECVVLQIKRKEKLFFFLVTALRILCSAQEHVYSQTKAARWEES